jgi:pseudouridylate synthase
LPVSARADTSEQAAAILAAHWDLDGNGAVLAQPLPAEAALDPGEFQKALQTAEQQATAAAVRGSALTPFLLARLAEITGGKTLRANQALVVANARTAAQAAVCLAR